MDLKALLDARFGIDLKLDQQPALNPELTRILARRTQRSYTDAPVPAPLIDLLLAVALSASAKSDFQQASVIKVTDAGKRERIAVHFPAMPWSESLPCSWCSAGTRAVWNGSPRCAVTRRKTAISKDS